MGREGERDFAAGSCGHGTVEVKENTARAHILGLGLEFVAFGVFIPQANHRRQAHIEAPHHAPLLRTSLNPSLVFGKHSSSEKAKLIKDRIQYRNGMNWQARRANLRHHWAGLIAL